MKLYIKEFYKKTEIVYVQEFIKHFYAYKVGKMKITSWLGVNGCWQPNSENVLWESKIDLVETLKKSGYYNILFKS